MVLWSNFGGCNSDDGGDAECSEDHWKCKLALAVCEHESDLEYGQGMKNTCITDAAGTERCAGMPASAGGGGYRTSDPSGASNLYQPLPVILGSSTTCQRTDEGTDRGEIKSGAPAGVSNMRQFFMLDLTHDKIAASQDYTCASSPKCDGFGSLSTFLERLVISRCLRSTVQNTKHIDSSRVFYK